MNQGTDRPHARRERPKYPGCTNQPTATDLGRVYVGHYPLIPLWPVHYKALQGTTRHYWCSVGFADRILRLRPASCCLLPALALLPAHHRPSPPSMHLPEPINSDAKLSYSTRSRRSWVVSRSRILLLVLVSFGTVWFQYVQHSPCSHLQELTGVACWLRRSQRLFPRAQIKHKPGSKDGLKVIEAYAFERVQDRLPIVTEVD